MINLTGQTALVTGSSRGIGKATAIRLAEAGADLILNYAKSRAAAETVAETIAQMGRSVMVVKADVSARDDVDCMMEAIDDEFGKLNIIVSNAASGGFRELMKSSEIHFEQTMNTNVKPLISLVQAAMPLFNKTDGFARVIGLSSHGSHRALPAYGLIGGSKAALESVARHLALELGDHDVRVNIVQAGLVETDSARMIPGVEEMFAHVESRTCVGARRLQPEDVANVVTYLASPMSDMIQGQTIIVDGGATVFA
ncbi:MAG: SDR family oxidoreductase [Planctomycetaceae bacterium]|jgi:enoyl-[acyl-carrier protein] reductase III